MPSTFDGDTDAEMLLQEFRTSPQLRIAVTVDMIATGTDIPSLECLLFLRDTRSRTCFDQHRAEITALQLRYSLPYQQRLTERMLKELENKLRDPIATRLSMDTEDFEFAPLQQREEPSKAHPLIGGQSRLGGLLHELNWAMSSAMRGSPVFVLPARVFSGQEQDRA